MAVKTMAERAAVQLWPFRTVGAMFVNCSALALLLATVSQAWSAMPSVADGVSSECGGATRADLVRDVLDGGIRLLALARLARVALIGVNVLHLATYAAVAVLQNRHRPRDVPRAGARAVSRRSAHHPAVRVIREDDASPAACDTPPSRRCVRAR